MQKLSIETKQKKFSPGPLFFGFKHKKLCLNTENKHALKNSRCFYFQKQERCLSHLFKGAGTVQIVWISFSLLQEPILKSKPTPRKNSHKHVSHH